MIELIQPTAGNLVAIRTCGEVTANDYEDVLIPALEEVLTTHSKARVLYQVEADSRFTAGAIWDDTSFGLGHLFSFERIAIVSGVDWINNSVKALSFMMPFQVRVFGPDDVQAALDWLGE